MKPMRILSTLACAAVLTVACGGDTRDEIGTADDSTSAVGTSGDVDAAGPSGSDREFVTEMLRDGSAEVQLGNLASERAQSPDVKQFGQMMVKDHTKAGEQLKQIAAQYNIQPETTALDDDHQDLMERLSKLRGAEFDREYMSAMVDGHEDVLDALESRADRAQGTSGVGAPGAADRSTSDQAGRNTTGQADRGATSTFGSGQADSGINRWAADTLPVVRGHLERARSIEQKLEASNRSDTSRR